MSCTRGQYTPVCLSNPDPQCSWKSDCHYNVFCICCSEAAAHAVATLAEATLQGGGQIVLAGETAAAVGALTGVQDGSGTNSSFCLPPSLSLSHTQTPCTPFTSLEQDTHPHLYFIYTNLIYNYYIDVSLVSNNLDLLLIFQYYFIRCNL